MSWQLPPPRNFGWQMKTLRSAHTAIRRLPQGSFELTIEHDLVRGVTPEMLAWWFRNLDGTMLYQGREYPRYLVWHPADHIQCAVQRPYAQGAGVGSLFHFVEALGGDMRKLINCTERIEKLDATGVRLVRRALGAEVCSLEHWFEPAEGGTRYRSRLQVGAESALGLMVFNPLLQRFLFTASMGYVWLRHSVEEVGNFEFFLPELYAKQAVEAPALSGILAN